MGTLSETKLRAIIIEFKKLKTDLDKLETELANVDIDEYPPAGREFINDMAFFHRRMAEIHTMYQADVFEIEESLNSKIIPSTMGSGLEVCGASR